MDGKKKRKNYFSNQASEQKKRRRLALECGMKGFFCTCNFREKDCVREAYNLLNEYADKLYGPEHDEIQKGSIQENLNVNENSEKEETLVEGNEVVEVAKNVEDNKNYKIDDNEQEEDISTALNKELDELKAEATKQPLKKRFQVVDTGVNNVIFINTTVPDTLELSTAIVSDLFETKKQKTRYLLRMLPIQVTCKAYLDDIKGKASVLFEKYFAQEPKTFSIIFNRHSNSNLNRDEIIEDLAQIIMQKNPGNKANLKNPEIAVVVEVIRATCLISIAPNYFTYKKYNLLEICKQKNKDS